ncbi:hypothetical protein H5410_040315, partial [Solanum commersonii]
MDEQGVHSPTNAKRSIASDNKDTASPDQTVAGKDTSNPFMAVTLPKGEGEGSSSVAVTQIIYSDPNGDRLVPDIEQNRPNTSPRNTNNNITRSNSSGEEDYGEHSYYQDAQNPNANDDSGMSFKCIFH